MVKHQPPFTVVLLTRGDHYATTSFGPYASMALVDRKVKQLTSPSDRTDRSVIVHSGNTSTPVAEYEIVPRMVLRTKTATGWSQRVLGPKA